MVYSSLRPSRERTVDGLPVTAIEADLQKRGKNDGPRCSRSEKQIKGGAISVDEQSIGAVNRRESSVEECLHSPIKESCTHTDTHSGTHSGTHKKRQPNDVDARWMVMRLAVSGVWLVAVLSQLRSNLVYWRDTAPDHVLSSAIGFFSYFTIDTAFISIAVLCIGSYKALSRAKTETDTETKTETETERSKETEKKLGLQRLRVIGVVGEYEVLRASNVVYCVVTSAVYNLILRPAAVPDDVRVPWADEFLHVVGPLFVLLDWIYRKPHKAMPKSKIVNVFLFPLSWLVYTYMRGPRVYDPIANKPYWYPYPFLSPLTSDGESRLGEVTLIISLLFSTFLLLSLIVWRLAR